MKYSHLIMYGIKSFVIVISYNDVVLYLRKSILKQKYQLEMPKDQLPWCLYLLLVGYLTDFAGSYFLFYHLVLKHQESLDLSGYPDLNLFVL